MRIVGGIHKGRKFHPPAKMSARPTTDFAKEALTSMIDHHFWFDQMSFLELFAGTGNIAFEMFSRGCRDLTVVEESRLCTDFIGETFEALEGRDCVRIVTGDVFRFLEFPDREYKLIFADPPYDHPDTALLPDRVLDGGWMLPKGWFILETGPGHDFSGHKNFFNLKRYGQSRFWIFSFEST